MVASYERKVAELTSEQARLHEWLKQDGQTLSSFDEMFELSMRFLASPYDIWENGGISAKRTVLRLVFAKPVVLDHNQGVRTPETTFPFKLLRGLEGVREDLVPQDGFEPPATYLRNKCSTS